MLTQNTVDQIKKASVEERIKVIEILLQSIKNDMSSKKSKHRQFKIRKFSLGCEVHPDRENLYSERGL